MEIVCAQELRGAAGLGLEEKEVICVHLIGGINTQGAGNGAQTSFVSEKVFLSVATRID